MKKITPFAVLMDEELAFGFSSRQNLLDNLLQNPASGYFIKEGKDSEAYNKQRQRLSVYFAQLDTGIAKRKISDKLIHALKYLMQEKSQDGTAIEKTISKFKIIVAETKSRKDPKDDDYTFFQMLDKQEEGRVVTIFTAQPLEVQDVHSAKELRVMNTRIEVLFDCLLGNREIKYNFNFPLVNICYSFYTEYTALLSIYIKNKIIEDSKFIDDLQNICPELKERSINWEEPNAINIATQIILKTFNRKKILNIYCLPEPVYSMRFFITNPSGEDITNCHGFIYLKSEGEKNMKMKIHKMSPSDIASFKTYVWPLIRGNHKGILVGYEDYLSHLKNTAR